MNELLIFAPVILGGIYLFIKQKNNSINITAPNISENFNPVQLNQEQLGIGGIPSIYNDGIGNYYINEQELNLQKQNPLLFSEKNQKNKIIFTSSMCKYSGGMSNSFDDMINKINGFSQ
jgi:hypothetical protein